MEIPRFASEDEERDFWATHDSTDFIEGLKGDRMEIVIRFKRKRLLCWLGLHRWSAWEGHPYQRDLLTRHCQRARCFMIDNRRRLFL